MKMFDFFSRHPIFSDTVSRLLTWFPEPIDHALAKYSAIKRAFHMTALDRTPGDYLEFGVYTGLSFSHAIRCCRSSRSVSPAETRFFGYDSFRGFSEDQVFYKGERYEADYAQVLRYLKRSFPEEDIHLVKGSFDHTLQGSCQALGIDRVRVAFIDCDHGSAALLALRYMARSLQPGTILLFDDYYLHQAGPESIHVAFHRFLSEMKDLRCVRLSHFGPGGVAYMVTRT